MSINSIFGALFIFHSVSLCVYIAFVFFLFFFLGISLLRFLIRRKRRYVSDGMQKVLVPFQSCIFIHPVVYFSALAWLNTVDVSSKELPEPGQEVVL